MLDFDLRLDVSPDRRTIEKKKRSREAAFVLKSSFLRKSAPRGRSKADCRSRSKSPSLIPSRLTKLLLISSLRITSVRSFVLKSGSVMCADR